MLDCPFNNKNTKAAYKTSCYKIHVRFRKIARLISHSLRNPKRKFQQKGFHYFIADHCASIGSLVEEVFFFKILYIFWIVWIYFALIYIRVSNHSFVVFNKQPKKSSLEMSWMNEWMNESVYSLKLENFYKWEQYLSWFLNAWLIYQYMIEQCKQ